MDEPEFKKLRLNTNHLGDVIARIEAIDLSHVANDEGSKEEAADGDDKIMNDEEVAGDQNVWAPCRGVWLQDRILSKRFFQITTISISRSSFPRLGTSKP